MAEKPFEIQWRLARLARRRRIITTAALRGELSREESDFLKPSASIRWLTSKTEGMRNEARA